jgi:hypothetical protein
MAQVPYVSKDTPLEAVLEYEVGTHIKLAPAYEFEAFATNVKSYAQTVGKLFEVSYVNSGTAAHAMYGVNTVVVRANEPLPLA